MIRNGDEELGIPKAHAGANMVYGRAVGAPGHSWISGEDEGGWSVVREDTVATVAAYLTALNSRDPDRIAALVTDDFINEHTSTHRPSVRGRDAYRARLNEFLAMFPKLNYEVEDTVVEGAKVVVAYRLRAERLGDGGDRSPRPIDVRGVFRFFLRDGEIAHRIDYFDGVTVEEQIGARSDGRSDEDNHGDPVIPR